MSAEECTFANKKSNSDFFLSNNFTFQQIAWWSGYYRSCTACKHTLGVRFRAVSTVIYEICPKESPCVSEEAVCDPSTVLSCWIFPVNSVSITPLLSAPLHQPVPTLLPVLYQDLWCMHALGLVWEKGRKGERDERGIGRGVKGRGVSWLFVLHCSHPCDQSREETCRALLQERHVVWFFKGAYNLKNQPLCFSSRMNTYNWVHNMIK